MTTAVVPPAPPLGRTPSAQQLDALDRLREAAASVAAQQSAQGQLQLRHSQSSESLEAAGQQRHAAPAQLLESSDSTLHRSLSRRPPSKRSSGIYQLSFAELREMMSEEGSPTSAALPPLSLATTSADSRRPGVASEDSAEAAAGQEPRARAVPGAASRAASLSPRLSQQLQQEPPGPQQAVLPHSHAVGARLDAYCAAALRFLDQLQQPEYRRHEEATKGQLPLSALKYAKGLAFQWSWKVGCMASAVWGRGFVIRRLPSGAWSAPSFFRLRQASLGMSLGLQTSAFLHTLQKPSQLRIFDKDRGVLGFDWAVCLGMDPIDQDVPMRARTSHEAAVRDETAPRTYSVVDGALLDFSLRAGFVFIDDALNAALYGPDQAPADILRGSFAPPPELQPLYDTLATLACAAPKRVTESRFEAQRQRSMRAAEEAAKPPSRVARAVLRTSESLSRLSLASLSHPSLDRGLRRNSSSRALALGGIGGGSPAGISPRSPSFRLFGDVGLGSAHAADAASPPSTSPFKLFGDVDLGEDWKEAGGSADAASGVPEAGAAPDA